MTTKGVTVHEVEVGKWQKIGTTITNGKQVLKIGDTIGYVATGSSYEDTWRLLNIDDEGRLEIIPSENVDEIDFSSSQIASLSTLLNSKAATYGNGAKAANARAIMAEYINNLTGYDPKTAAYEEGTITEYGVTIEYYWVGNEFPYYVYNNEGQQSAATSYTGNFCYMSNDAFVTATKDTSATTTDKKLITKITNIAYSYTANKYISEDSPIYDVDGKPDDVSYFLANPVAYNTDNGLVVYSFLYVLEGGIRTAFSFTGSPGAGITLNVYGVTSGFRPMVTLEEDTKLTGSSTTGWNIVTE